MTNEELQKLIDMYNSNTWNLPIHEFEIAPNVMFARIPEQINKSDHLYPISYFIIKSENECVSIIEDRGKSDLHWFVDPKHRKKGYLHDALQKIILPFIADHLDRCEQRGTVIKTNDTALNYALRQGFKTTGDETDTVYILKHDFDGVPNYDNKLIKRIKLLSEREQELKSEFEEIIMRLRLIDNEMFCSFGNQLALNNIIAKLKSYSEDIQHLNNIGSIPNN